MTRSFNCFFSLKRLSIATLTALSFTIVPEIAHAGCNPFGCSQSSVAECNPFGCPKAPMGGDCTPFGCPPSPQPPPNTSSANPIIVVPNGGMPNSNANTGGSGQAIAHCMKSLLYNQYGYRTQISEDTAVQACCNAR